MQSPGWARFLQHVEQTWGDAACMAQIDAALKRLPAGELDAEYQTVTQIRAAARSIQALMRFPDERIRALVEPGRSKRPFESLRRITR